MIDNLALGLSHGLMILAAWRLLTRPDLDDARLPAPPPTPRNSRWSRPNPATPDLFRNA